MHVRDLAKKLSVPPDTIRYYVRIKLLAPKSNPANGYKEFDSADETRLKFILTARNLGFSVADIRQILGEADQQRSPCSLARQLIRQRLEENEAKFQDMLALRERMLEATKKWECMDDKTPTENSICHLIESFSIGDKIKP